MPQLTQSHFLPFFFPVLITFFDPHTTTARKSILNWMGFVCFVFIKAETNAESFSTVKQNNILLQHVFLFWCTNQWTSAVNLGDAPWFGKGTHPFVRQSLCSIDSGMPREFGASFWTDIFCWGRLSAFSLLSHWAWVLPVWFSHWLGTSRQKPEPLSCLTVLPCQMCLSRSKLSDKFKQDVAVSEQRVKYWLNILLNSWTLLPEAAGWSAA